MLKTVYAVAVAAIVAACLVMFTSLSPQVEARSSVPGAKSDRADVKVAGSPAPGHYAQSQPASPPEAIGKVKKVVGRATAIRNGIVVALNVGDAVYTSDVIQTGGDSSVGIYFLDGPALNLLANTRMALNEYSFDSNRTSNVVLFNLIRMFGFVAGKVARTGDMKIATPVAMGIRGPR